MKKIFLLSIVTSISMGTSTTMSMDEFNQSSESNSNLFKSQEIAKLPEQIEKLVCYLQTLCSSLPIEEQNIVLRQIEAAFENATDNWALFLAVEEIKKRIREEESGK